MNYYMNLLFIYEYIINYNTGRYCIVVLFSGVCSHHGIKKKIEKGLVKLFLRIASYKNNILRENVSSQL